MENKEIFLTKLNANSDKINQIGRYLKDYPDDLEAKDEMFMYILSRETALAAYEKLF